MPKPKPLLDVAAVSRLIEMAWEDRTTFEAIEAQFGWAEADVAATLSAARTALGPLSGQVLHIGGWRLVAGDGFSDDGFKLSLAVGRVQHHTRHWACPTKCRWHHMRWSAFAAARGADRPGAAIV